MSTFKTVMLALICMGAAGLLTVWYWYHVVVPAPFPLNWVALIGAVVFVGWLWTQTEEKE